MQISYNHPFKLDLVKFHKIIISLAQINLDSINNRPYNSN